MMIQELPRPCITQDYAIAPFHPKGLCVAIVFRLWHKRFAPLSVAKGVNPKATSRHNLSLMQAKLAQWLGICLKHTKRE